MTTAHDRRRSRPFALRKSANGAVVRVSLALLLAMTACLSLSTRPVRAHSPHDIVRSVALSPSYSQDRTAFLITDTPAGWWKPTHVYRSVDGGVSWQSIVNGLDNRHKPSDVKLSPQFQSDGFAFIATTGDGVYRSLDRGASWVASNVGLGTLDIARLALSPSFATDRTVLAAGAGGGLFVSVDRGGLWSRALGDQVHIHSLGFARRADGRLLTLAGDSAGNLVVSADGGFTWRNLLHLPAVGAITAIAASPDFGSDSTLFLGTESMGLWRVVNGSAALGDAGDNAVTERVELPTPSGPGTQPVGPTSVQNQTASVYLPTLFRDGYVIDPTQPGLGIADIEISPNFGQDQTVLVAARKGLVFRTQDGGTTWREVGSEQELTHDQADELGEPDFSDLELSSSYAADKTVFLAGYMGLFKSEDGGDAWKEVEVLMVGLPTGLSISPNYAIDGHVALATQHAGSIVSHDAGGTWEVWNRGMVEGRIYNIEHSPAYAQDGFLYTFDRSQVRRTVDNGANYVWEAWNYGYRPPEAGGGAPALVNFPESTAISPSFASDATMFIGTRHYGVYASYDGGQSWRHLWERVFEIASLAISPNFGVDHTLFASVVNDGVFKSVDGGATWSYAGFAAPWIGANAPETTPYWRYLSHLAISPNFAQDGVLFAGSWEGLFKTETGGAEWEVLTQFAGKGIVALAVSPNYVHDRTLFVSVKGLGLYKSQDGGATFAAVAPQLLRRQHLLRKIEMSPAYATDQTLYGYGDHLLRSTDGGHTWQVIERPVRYENHKYPIRYLGDWVRRNDEQSSMSSYSASGGTGEQATLDFAGTGVAWLGTRAHNLGIANVYVDGALEAVVDQYASDTQSEVVLFSIAGLAAGPHTVAIEVTGRRNPDSRGASITLDAFDVVGYEAASHAAELQP